MQALYLSENGVYWKGVMADEKVTSFEARGDKLIINGSEEHELPELEESLVIKYNDRYIGTEHEPFITDGVSYVPVRDLAEVHGLQGGMGRWHHNAHARQR